VNIYAIRDRLIAYYLHPFAASNDKEVLAAVATTINREGNPDAIAQAPHHFELWELGIIDDEEGQITPTRRLVCDCASLIRVGVRPRREREGAQAAEATGADPQVPGGTRYAGRAPNGSIPHPAQGPEASAGEVRRRPQGSDTPRDVYEKLDQAADRGNN